MLLCCTLVQAEALLLDPAFQQGYVVMSPQKDIYTARTEQEAVHFLRSPEPTALAEPVWRLVQWGSNSSIAPVSPQTTSLGGKRWKLLHTREKSPDIYKAVALNPGGELTLEQNALMEFNGRYLDSLEQYWPHLLMAQNLQTKKLHTYQNINLSLDAKLLFDHKNMAAGYQSGVHAARFPIAISVRNTLSGNMFWLSLVIYDDRYPESDFICQKCVTNKDGNESCFTPVTIDTAGRWQCPFDGNRWSTTSEKKGTRKMIFRIPTKAITHDNIQKGEWTHYQVDLLPYIKEGIKAARETRQLRGFSPELRFYELGFFSMGWEITGLNHAAITVKNLSLTGL